MGPVCLAGTLTRAVEPSRVIRFRVLVALCVLVPLAPVSDARAEASPDGWCHNSPLPGQAIVQRLIVPQHGWNSMAFDWDWDQTVLATEGSDANWHLGWYIVDADTHKLADYFVITEEGIAGDVRTNISGNHQVTSGTTAFGLNSGYWGTLGATQDNRRYWVITYLSGDLHGVSYPLSPPVQLSWKVKPAFGVDCESVDLPREVWGLDESGFTGDRLDTPVAGYSGPLTYQFERTEDVIVGTTVFFVQAGDVERNGSAPVNSYLMIETPTGSGEQRTAPRPFATTAGVSKFRAMYRGVRPGLSLSFAAIDLPDDPAPYFAWWPGQPTWA